MPEKYPFQTMEPHGQSPWYLLVHPWGGILSEPTATGRGASRRIEPKWSLVSLGIISVP